MGEPYGTFDDGWDDAIADVDEVNAIGPEEVLKDLPIASLVGERAPQFSLVTGTAGTGKTFNIRQWAEADPDVVLAATTGIAAVNMGDATTINALLHYYNTESLQEKFLNGWLETNLRHLWGDGVRRIILDEVSMLDARQLDFIVDAVCNIEEKTQGQQRMGLTLVGDFCQLPPVKAPFAFTATHWPKFAEHHVKLTQIHRQADPAFIAALQAVRSGTANPTVLAPLRRAYRMQTDLKFDGVTLLAKNDEVDRLNLQRYRALTTPEVRWLNHRAGKPHPDWKHIPEVLPLKEGQLVMVLANRPIRKDDDDWEGKRFQYRYVNGDLAHVVDPGVSPETMAPIALGEKALKKDEAQAKIDARIERKPLVKLVRNGQVVPVSYVHREVFDPNDDRKKKIPVGEINYLPLRSAWATTCHKSQGLSFDTVQISMRDPFWASPGMAYVALSRCRSVAGLHLVGNEALVMARARVSPEVKDWI